jgi:hypothetical protein
MLILIPWGAVGMNHVLRNPSIYFIGHTNLALGCSSSGLPPYAEEAHTVCTFGGPSLACWLKRRTFFSVTCGMQAYWTENDVPGGQARPQAGTSTIFF